MSWPFVANAVGLAFILAISHALLRHGATLGQAPFAFPRIAYTAAAMLIYVALFFYYSQLLQRFAMSRLYPIYSGLSILFVYVFGTLLFRESFSFRGLVGTTLIIVGVLAITTEQQS